MTVMLMVVEGNSNDERGVMILTLTFEPVA